MEEDKKQKLLLEKHKDIARIDQESKRTHGWYVRVRFLGKTHSKFFSDRKCGGRYSSLLSAISWRDKTEKKLGKVRTNKHITAGNQRDVGLTVSEFIHEVTDILDPVVWLIEVVPDVTVTDDSINHSLVYESRDVRCFDVAVDDLVRFSVKHHVIIRDQSEITFVFCYSSRPET